MNSGIGHYSLVLAMLPPLIIDRVLRLVTGQGSPVRNGLWLGLLIAAQLFISEELLVDTVIATVDPAGGPRAVEAAGGAGARPATPGLVSPRRLAWH